ncbi:MAG: molybdopterin cofactor-binding domain-containing protein, partial [Pseudomonadota bacterium]
DRFDHQKLRFGDVEAAFARADHIVEGTYQMSPIEQAPIETCGAIAAPETNDRIVCYTGTQALFFSLGVTAKQLDMSSSRLHFIGGTVGGGFGGKVDSHHEPLAVLGALMTGRPVKYQWDRAEEMQISAPRSGERWRIKDGVMHDGQIIARQFTGFFDAGAYTRLTSYGVQKCTGHLPGPYTIPNVASNVFCVFTNRTPATAMRGFGITGVDFSIECHMDKVAEAVGMDPIELRILNAYRDGDMKAHRRSAKNCALIEACQVAAEKSDWRLSGEALAASSMTEGGIGWRAEIAGTSTDTAGQIGQRRRDGHLPDPYAGVSERGHVAAGFADPHATSALGNAPQDQEMTPETERLGFKVIGGSAEAEQPVQDSSVPGTGSAPQIPKPPAEPTPNTSRPPSPMQPYRPSSAGPSLPSGYQGSPYSPTASVTPSADVSAPQETEPTARTTEPADVKPAEPAKPARRPGVSGFVRGRRR